MNTYGDQLDEDGRRRLEVINATARQMRGLVEGLLLYARSSGRRLRVEDAPLDQLIAEACEAVRTMMDETGASLDAGPLPIARVDRRLFVHVLQNLFNNALKFRREEPPRIRVTCEVADGVIVLCVADNGRGFEMKHCEMIFQSFTRLHRRDEVAGEGIGLALCKRIVERHGGRIWAESEPGVGSRFFLRIAQGREHSRAA
jgi:light-regulated signal transduction histidine kinase (bacteriophytochrome)